MAIDTANQRSRRTLLAAALGGIGAFAASALGRAAPTTAFDGQTVTVGNSFTGTNATEITNTALGGTAIWGASTSGVGVKGSSDTFHGVQGTGKWGVTGTGTSWGVTGSSTSGYGVLGNSTSGYGMLGTTETGWAILATSNATDKPAITGVSTFNSTAVLGFSGDGATPAAKAKTGVYGQATQDAQSRGVWGRATTGRGVFGQAGKGVGVFGAALNVHGFAFRGSGRVRFDKISGVATIPAGSTSVTVTPGVDVTADSFVLLTPMAKLGGRDLWFTKNVSTNKITIRMSSSRAVNTKIAWLLLR